MNRKYWDLASGIGLLVLAVVLFIGSTQVKSLDVSRFGAGFFPAIVAGLLFIVGLVVLGQGLKKARGPEEKAENKPGKGNWGVLATFGLMAAYAALLPLLGFLISTSLYLFLQITLLSPKDKRRYPVFGLISVLSSVVVYYTFVKVFQLLLPAGILG